jgi:hypothetical protein
VKIARELAVWVAVGALVVVGMRAAEWLIPKPETRLIVCFAEDVDNSRTCKTLDELIRKP